MDLFTDVEAEFVGQTSDEKVEARLVSTVIILQGFLYLKIQLVIDLVLEFQIIKLKHLLL